MNDFIDRTKLSDPSFDFTEEPFDFSIRLWVFNRCRDMPDVVKSKELSEFMVGMNSRLHSSKSISIFPGIPQACDPIIFF